MKQCGIYSITCQSNGKRYVGSSTDIKARWQQHRAMLRHNRHYNPYLQRAWAKYGESAFVFEVLEFTTDDACLDRETHWIAAFNACHKDYGYNDKSIANASRHSDEMIARIAAKRRGQKASSETRAKMSASRQGRVFSPETRAKISAANRGRELSSGQAKAMRQLQIANGLSAETKAKMGAARSKRYVVTDPDGQKYHITNLSAFCREQGIDPRRLSSVASGSRNAWKGWKCEYMEVAA